MVPELRSCAAGVTSATPWASTKKEGLAKRHVKRHKLDADVERVVGTCAQVPEALHPWEWPDKLWRRLRVDHTGHVWLIINVSEWPCGADELTLKVLLKRSLMGSGETRRARALLRYRMTPQSPTERSTDRVTSRGLNSGSPVS